jgi:hypothetical protein
MMEMLGNLVLFVWSKFKITSNLAAENLALRQQLVVMKRTNRRPKIQMTDRLFWVLFLRIWSPWQNPFIERMIGLIRRECTDRVIVLNEAHLISVLGSYFEYYHNDRTHLSLEKDPPDTRPIQSRPAGKCKIIALPRIGGLHHRYEWKKAA